MSTINIILPNNRLKAIKKIPLSSKYIFADFFDKDIYQFLLTRTTFDKICIIGDMDSLKSHPTSIKIYKNSCQDTTDLEKILATLDDSADNIIISSPSIGRSDHFIYNLELLKKYNHLNIFIYTEIELIYLAKNNINITSSRGRAISFFSPFGKSMITSQSGLLYELPSKLDFGVSSSQSNKINSQNLTLSFDGDLLVILEHLGDNFILKNNTISL